MCNPPLIPNASVIKLGDLVAPVDAEDQRDMSNKFPALFIEEIDQGRWQVFLGPNERRFELPTGCIEFKVL